MINYKKILFLDMLFIDKLDNMIDYIIDSTFSIFDIYNIKATGHIKAVYIHKYRKKLSNIYRGRDKM